MKKKSNYEIAVSPIVIKKALLTSFVVGSILVCINQGDLILYGNWNTNLYWKIPFTYVVPYCVTTWGAMTKV
jgi:hypothetical protein